VSRWSAKGLRYDPSKHEKRRDRPKIKSARHNRRRIVNYDSIDRRAHTMATALRHPTRMPTDRTLFRARENGRRAVVSFRSPKSIVDDNAFGVFV